MFAGLLGKLITLGKGDGLRRREPFSNDAHEPWCALTAVAARLAAYDSEIYLV